MDEQPKKLHQRFYTLDTIPDLTLSKYSALGYSNPKDVLDQQRAFWRQIERRGSLMNETYQLIYAYDPLGFFSELFQVVILNLRMKLFALGLWVLTLIYIPAVIRTKKLPTY